MTLPADSVRKLSQLLNPYTNLSQEQMVRAQLWVDPKDKYLLNSVFPLRGIETFMLAGLYQQVCKELRELNITSYSPENATIVTDLIARHLAPVSLSGERPITNESGGVDEVRQPHPNTPNLTPDVHKATKGRRGNKRGK
jgi:hypothetical protein